MQPRRKKCTNNPRVPQNERETNLYTCFKRGVGVGMRLALKPPLNTMSLRQLSDMGSKYRIPYYSRMNKAELIWNLQQRNYPRSPEPR